MTKKYQINVNKLKLINSFANFIYKYNIAYKVLFLSNLIQISRYQISSFLAGIINSTRKTISLLNLEYVEKKYYLK